MRTFRHMFGTALLAGLMSMALLTGCGAQEGSTSGSAPPETDGTVANPEASSDFRPADTGVPAQDEFSFPVLGLTVQLPQTLQDEITADRIFMQGRESITPDGRQIAFAQLFWSSMTEEQREAVVPKKGSDYEQWVNALTRVGTLGVYHRDLTDRLDEFSGCTEHKLLGESSDGYYQYYLSLNPAADEAARKIVDSIHVEIGEMGSFHPGNSVFGASVPSSTSVGKFTMQDIYGNEYAQDIFQEADLTVLNLFTTWCSPCVNEIPELEKLDKEMEAKGVNVVGVVLDSVDQLGKPVPEIIEKAKILAERTGATYPFLIPDETAMNGHLLGIDAVPHTLFVDKEGNIVYSIPGARNLEDWTALVEQELAAMKGE